MDKKKIQRIKKISLYVFAVIGIITVIGFVFGAILVVFRSTGYRSYRPASPSVLEMDAMPDTLGGEKGLSKPTSYESESEIAEEGELTERKIIKNGSLSLLVKKAEETVAAVQELAKELEGFVSSSRIYEVSDGVKSGTIMIRVPLDHFNEAIRRIKEMAVKVEGESQEAKDVTEQFIDLEAQLRNLRQEEEQYLKVMESADTIDEILKVSSRLSSVRGKIEQIEGRLKYLSRQVEMSTIIISLTSEAEVEVFGIRWRPLIVVKKSFQRMLEGLTNYADSLIKIVFALPMIILWMATISAFLIVVCKAIKYIKRKFWEKDNKK